MKMNMEMRILIATDNKKPWQGTVLSFLFLKGKEGRKE
jgi:hypothetical protein